MRSVRVAAPLLLAASAFVPGGCREPPPAPLVVLIGLDGATPSVLNELRAEGKLPSFERLARRGVSGRLQSLAARRVLMDSPRRGFYSPIVWTSIATGQVPDEHGVRDFILPIGDTASAWMGAGEGSPEAALTFPEIEGEGSLTLRLRLHSHGELGAQDVRVALNGVALGTLRVPASWSDRELALPASALRPATNRLSFEYSRRTVGTPGDPRQLAVELGQVRIQDFSGRTLVALDPVVDRFSLGRGFYPPTARTTEVQSGHWRQKPVWMLLGERRVPVGVIGYWGTWPADEVNGFLVSSRMGIRDVRVGSDRLTWPPGLAERLEPLAPTAADLGEMFDRLHVSGCEPRFVDRKSVLKKILVQDELYARIAEELFPAMERGLATVYFRSIDVSSHVALPFRYGAPVPEGCPASLRDVVEAVYVQVDAWIGRVLDALPPKATVVIVSDHGMAPLNDTMGGHAAEGIFLASGRGLRRGGRLRGANVLDVAPTLLYLLRAPIPLGMDGKVLVQAFEEDALAQRPPVYRDIDTSLAPGEPSDDEASKELLDELRSLGYLP